MAARGIAVASIGIGAIFAWSGFNNKKITQTIQDLVRGQQPQPGPAGQMPNLSGVFGPGVSGTIGNFTGAGNVGPGGSAMGQAIATDALAYQGQGYVWGGAPAQGLGHWDCSSFANWVIGHDNGLTIPGYPHGSYTGASHGPNTLAWLASIGTVTSRIPRSAVSAGDLIVWQTHMGIAINNQQMISAQNPSSGTQVSNIDGFISGEIMVPLRLKQAAQSIFPPAGPPPVGGGRKH